ncbi:MAG: hypothetical protein M3Y89_17355, partial [Actinomycetota bacterium]|nr:hypothetical protein [Actinomycetota bacterium]
MDLRLALAVLLAWVAVLWGLTRSAATVAAVTGALLVAVGMLVLAGRRRSRLTAAAFAAATVALVLAPLAARLHQARDSQLGALARGGLE